MMRSPQGGLSAGMDRRKAALCPRWGSDPASGHPSAQKPPLGSSPSPVGVPTWTHLAKANDEGSCPPLCGPNTEQ